ncbi:MAG: Do family serine endopeptidase [Planctomycetota bacterium]
MRRRYLQSMAAGILAATILAGRAGAVDARALEGAFVKAVERVAPAVVHIRVEMVVGGRRMPADPFEYFFGPRSEPRRKSEGFGSGVIVSRDGLVITNHHVAGEADRIEVKLADGRTLPAERVGTDPKTDLCLLRIAGEGHAFAEFGRSEELKVGQWALAIGNPFGLSDTVTLGIVSARGRHGFMGGGGYEDFIQTDAAINPGNSGGPLVNIDGEIIGINTMIFSRSGGNMGVGFAIPSDLVTVIMDRLLKEGRVVRSWLGVGIQNVTSDLARAFRLDEVKGALVTEVYPESPASRAGFRRGDVVMAVDGEAVTAAGDLRNRVAHTPVGTEVAVEVLRDGGRRTLKARLERHPSEPDVAPEREEAGRPQTSEKIGIDLVEVTPRIARQLRLDKAKGLAVVGVRPGGLAEAAGLKLYDVILEANRRPLKTVRDFGKALGALEPGGELLLLVRDREGVRFVVLRPRK